MDNIILTPSQQRAYAAMMRGENVFLTGGAGTGKTTLIKKFIREVDPYCKHTILAASTGKAALNMEVETPDGKTIYGQTVHKVFNLKADTLPKFKGNVPQMLKVADRIIIDEISMVRMDIFEYLADAYQEEAMNFIRDIEERPLQIILVGDFFQLPPVIKSTCGEGDSDKKILDMAYAEDVGKAYCFQSNEWNLLDIKTYELTEIMRQKDDEEFCIALNKIRIGDPSGIVYINKNSTHSSIDLKRITICGKNSTAIKINQYMLGRNPNPKECFQRSIETKRNNIQSYLKELPCEESLYLCKGTRVICTANNESAVNGAIGTIVRIEHDNVTVAWDNGEINKVEPYEWKITRQDAEKDPNTGKLTIHTTEVLKATQLPLKIAYAITAHKAQGTTLPAANIFMDFFETGHLYTALSRVEKVEGIILKRMLKESDVRCDKAINNFYYGGNN